MLSDNIIERQQALAQLMEACSMDLNLGSMFYLAVIALGIICWWVKEWI